MARRCELTGKGVQVGHNVSHANNKTKRRYLPNLIETTVPSEALKRSFRLKLSAAALRTLDHAGGLDAWLAKTPAAKLSATALRIKRDLAKIKAKAA